MPDFDATRRSEHIRPESNIPNQAGDNQQASFMLYSAHVCLKGRRDCVVAIRLSKALMYCFLSCNVSPWKQEGA